MTGWAGYYSEAIYPLLGGSPANGVRRPLSVDAQSIQNTSGEECLQYIKYINHSTFLHVLVPQHSKTKQTTHLSFVTQPRSYRSCITRTQTSLLNPFFQYVKIPPQNAFLSSLNPNSHRKSPNKRPLPSRCPPIPSHGPTRSARKRERVTLLKTGLRGRSFLGISSIHFLSSPAFLSLFSYLSLVTVSESDCWN